MRLTRRIRLWRALSSLSDVRAANALLRLEDTGRGGEPIAVRLRALRGNHVLCRPGTTDLRTLFDTFVKQYHVAPVRLDNPTCILDLGANVGYTAAHFAGLYPSARIVAVEMDSENSDLAARNTAAWADRVTVLQAAVWSRDGYASYGGDIEDGYAVSRWIDGSVEKPPTGYVRSRGIGGILDEFGIERVDYLKMDIEGAEEEVLAGSPEWLSRVDSIKIEVHNGKDMGVYFELLRSAGLRSWKDTRHWSCVAAARDRLSRGGDA